MENTFVIFSTVAQAAAVTVIGLVDGLEQLKGLQLLPWTKDTHVLLAGMQQRVGGRLERVPQDTQVPHDPTLQAYVNERGIEMRLAPNAMGWHVLRALGFSVSPCVTLYGPLLFLDVEDAPLSRAHQEAIRKHISQYMVRFTPVPVLVSSSSNNNNPAMKQ